MPELPEVEHARRWIAARTPGRTLADVLLPDPAAIRSRLSSRPSDADPSGAARVRARIGQTFGAPLRHGKRLGLPLGDGGLLVHLGMSGRFVEGPAPPHGRIGLVIDQGPTLWLDDPRRFGCVVVSQAVGADLREGLGPDALASAPDGPALRTALADARTLKAGLLEQGRIAGIGNIQAVEALWLARLHPATPTAHLTAEDWDRLAASLRQTLLATLESSGAGQGEIIYVSRNKNANPFQVYGRSGAPCPRCAVALVQERLAGRATVRCPRCQPAPG